MLATLGKCKKVSRFIKTRVNGGPTFKLIIFVVKGSDYQLPQRLKLLHCFPYVIESRGVYEIC